MSTFYIDKHLITAKNFSAFLKATAYSPKDPTNFLKNWEGNNDPPASLENTPVTYISYEEAKMYCAWRKMRLPHAYEWQLAAQGRLERLYPWGWYITIHFITKLPSFLRINDQSAYPKPVAGHDLPDPVPIGSFSPNGDSPYGVAEMFGHVINSFLL